MSGADPDMHPERLNILCLSQMPPSPPQFGAQARMHGLYTNLARRHDVTAVALVDEAFDAKACERAMREYCREVVLVPNPRGRNGAFKRALQLRSVASLQSFERHRHTVPGLQPALDRILSRQRFDVVDVEFPFLAHYELRKAPPGAPEPLLIIDAHEIEYDMVRQFARSGGMARRLYAGWNWRKLRGEELAVFRAADGIFTCSQADRDRVLAEVGGARTVVIPNAADVDFYQPRPIDPPPDGNTLVFFGLLSTWPNIDGILFFLREVWPRILARRPQTRLKIIGKDPPPEVRGAAGPGVEVTGFVSDLRPHLSSAAALVVPLRIGGGTRLKIVEGMAMARPIVSTALGAEGIEAVPGRDILIADEPEAFAASVLRLLDDPALAERVGRSARQLAVEKYAWSTAAVTLERFCRDLLEARSSR